MRGGNEYRVAFTVTCESIVDPATAEFGIADCDFSVSRGSFTLTVEPDIIGLVEMLTDDIAAHDANVVRLIAMLTDDIAAHDAKVQALIETHDGDIKALLELLQTGVDGNRKAILEAIRLLNTPTGKRSSEELACGGEPCDFPDGQNN